MALVHAFDALPGEEPFAASLLEFNNMFVDLDARRAQENDERIRAAAQSDALMLGLMGLNAPARRRVIIEPLRNRLRRPYQLDISRDFDSLISFTDELPVAQDLYIHRVFHQMMTLTKSLHVKVRMHTQPGQVGVDFMRCHLGLPGIILW